MDDLSLVDLARVTVDGFRREHDLPAATAAALVSSIEIALLTAVRHERSMCAALCAARAALWQTTADRPQTLEPLRQEAVMRAKEATYLTDAITTRR